ncbi:MAG: hypothetical protein A2Y14_05020 [Verrucomicrobia bacterium GWF2_51_19]|nr:MAG: hypothetical protein A2Y14_05020 [Verrucomicrobia bacterium GWF2_51_19]HCJ11775.1 3-methyladenine DNA glycosylase [Opitutae bacterium]
MLGEAFYRKSTLEVARQLIGKTLCRAYDNGVVQRLSIGEVEAYDGFEDKASHAHKGRTERNAPMFDAGGRWYIYLCYGVHWMLNIVTGDKDYPAAVLIRGAGTLSGPGKLTRALSIDKSFNDQPAMPISKLWIEDAPSIDEANVARFPRIGVSYAGPHWAAQHYRFKRVFTCRES